MKLNLSKSKKKENYIDTLISLTKIDLAKVRQRAVTARKKSMIFFESLPLGKELKEAFVKLISTEKLSELEMSDNFKLHIQHGFMFHFYKTLFISIDKELRLSKNIGFMEVKESFSKTENKIKLGKALSLFNCKNENNYYEFSKNGVIELYSQDEYLKLLLRIDLRKKDKELAELRRKAKRKPLKDDSDSIEVYTQIIRAMLISRIEGQKETDQSIIFDVNMERDDYTTKLSDRFYKWSDRNPERFKNIVDSEFKKLIPNNDLYFLDFLAVL